MRQKIALKNNNAYIFNNMKQLERENSSYIKSKPMNCYCGPMCIFIIVILIFPLCLRLYRKLFLVKFALVGKTVIVTGANTGIGYQTALECAKRGARLIIACENKPLGTKALETIIKTTGNKNVIFKLLDLASLKSVRSFADDVLKNEERLDILINNAAVLMRGNEMTSDGFQLEMQINYISPVLLTLLLIDMLKKSSPSRIINVASIAAKYAKNFTPETINSYTDHISSYANSKLGNILFTQELGKKLKDSNISVFSLHPGITNTGIAIKNFNPIFRVCAAIFSRVFFMSPEEGAQTTLYTALEQGIERFSGCFFEQCKVAKPYKTATNPALARQIWDVTLNLLKYDEDKIR